MKRSKLFILFILILIPASTAAEFNNYADHNGKVLTANSPSEYSESQKSKLREYGDNDIISPKVLAQNSQTQNNYDFSAERLMIAVSSGDIQNIKTLLASGLDVNAKSKDGTTPLIFAAERGSAEVVLFLLDCGADINAKSNEGATPLLQSLKYYDKEKALILISKGASISDKDSEGRTPLILAVIREHKDVVERLIEKGADINAKDDDGLTALMYTPRYNHSTDIAKHLLSKGADKNIKDVKGLTASMHAAKLIKKSDFGILLSSDNYGITELMTAAKNNDINTIKQLIAKGTEINRKDTAGDTALVYAIKAKHLGAVELLIKNGADTNSRDINGVTPLIDAVIGNDKVMVELLIDNRADPNAKVPGTPVTALSSAQWNGFKEIYKLLIAKGAKEFSYEQVLKEPVEATEKEVNALWAGLCEAMLAGNVEKAASYFALSSQERYQYMFKQMIREKLNIAAIFSNKSTLTFNKNFKPGDPTIECSIIRNEISYPIKFVRDLDGSWKIYGF